MPELLEKIRQAIKQAYHNGCQFGLQKGYELGWQAGQMEKSEDKEIADNMKSYWAHQRCGAEK